LKTKLRAGYALGLKRAGAEELAGPLAIEREVMGNALKTWIASSKHADPAGLRRQLSDLSNTRGLIARPEDDQGRQKLACGRPSSGKGGGRKGGIELAHRNLPG